MFVVKICVCDVDLLWLLRTMVEFVSICLAMLILALVYSTYKCFLLCESKFKMIFPVFLLSRFHHSDDGLYWVGVFRSILFVLISVLSIVLIFVVLYYGIDEFLLSISVSDSDIKLAENSKSKMIEETKSAIVFSLIPTIILSFFIVFLGKILIHLYNKFFKI